MINSFLQDNLRKFYIFMIRHITDKYNCNDLSRSAIVFSPHPDDETLGCGGTIIKKKRAGADVKIVFMTDGSRSHQHLISEESLAAIRTREALAASQIIGLHLDDVFFLKFKDSNLSEHMKFAITKVLEILQRQQPDEIFIPYHKEPSSWSGGDHLATNRIVVSAAKVYGREVAVYEYPIAFWLNCLQVSLGNLKKNLLSGLNLLMDLRCSVYIGDVLKLKRAALNQYKSQMTRPPSHSRWITIGDILNGEFLRCFFQEYEIFRRYLLTQRSQQKFEVNNFWLSRCYR